MAAGEKAQVSCLAARPPELGFSLFSFPASTAANLEHSPFQESPGEKPAGEHVGSEMHPGLNLPGRSFSEACSALDSACQVPGAGLVQVTMNQVDTVD